MRLAKVMAISALLAGCAQSRIQPTKTGDIIGSATMAEDRSISVTLVSTDCKGMIAHGEMVVVPSDARYAEILQHVGPLVPKETKPVKAWPSPPCR